MGGFPSGFVDGHILKQSHECIDRFECLVGDVKGNKRYRHDLGETCIAVSVGDRPFELIGPRRKVPLTDAGWMTWRREKEGFFRNLDMNRRREAAKPADSYWEKRHNQAFDFVSRQANKASPKILGWQPPSSLPRGPIFCPLANSINMLSMLQL